VRPKRRISLHLAQAARRVDGGGSIGKAAL
jgi:hypothetical protein